ncbi:MAG: hypothetical protein KKD99_06865 [Proteobacteria bacterium]|nr:hypothetical protein [Pseudomonadota bacterium]
MTKRAEAEDFTGMGTLVSSFGATNAYMGKTPQQLAWVTEDPVYVRYLQMTPVSLKAGQIQQNVLVLNVAFFPQSPAWNTKEYSLENYIADRISEITEVEYIFIRKDGNVMDVSIIINKLDRTVRDRIYDIEYSMIDRFRDDYLDFHVISRDDRDINKLFSPKAIMIYRRSR